MRDHLIDLHGHTIESDGTFTIPEYVKKAYTIGLSAIAITNHDTVEGVEQFMKEVSKYPNLCGIPGAELEADFLENSGLNPVHAKFEILALDIKNLSPLITYQNFFKKRRKEVLLTRIKLLNDNGIPITYEDIAYDSQGRLRSVFAKPHIAAYLLENGYIQNLQEAYDRYLNPGGIAYVALTKTSVKEVSNTIKASGALRIVAHPALLNLSDSDLYHFIKTLKEENMIDGLEVMHYKHSFQQMETYLDIAEALNLFVSGGSDFHGLNKPGIEMGYGNMRDFSEGNIAVPEVLLESIQNRITPSKSDYAELRHRIHMLNSIYIEQVK